MCPYCSTEAPLIYRGLEARCAACGARRTVLAAPSVTYAGRPEALGATLLGALGWSGLVLGILGALFFGGVTSLIWDGEAGLWVLGVLSLVSVGFFFLVRKGRRALSKARDVSRDELRERAAIAVAARMGGWVLPHQVSGALELSVDDSDMFLTTLAKSKPSHVLVELGQHGEVFYGFKEVLVRAAPRAPRVRVEAEGTSLNDERKYARVKSERPEIIDAEFEPWVEKAR